MWIINCSFLLVLLTGYLFCKGDEDWRSSIDKREHKLYALYPLSNWILTKTGLEKLLNRRDTIKTSIKALYIISKPEALIRLYWCSRISAILLVLALFQVFSLLNHFIEISNSALTDGKYIMRPDYGAGSVKIPLQVLIEPKDEAALYEDTVSDSMEVTIPVNERLYTEEEISQVFDKAFRYLEKAVLGNNESAELIYENLYFCNRIPDLNISVSWHPEDYSLIHTDGTVSSDNIREEGITTYVRVILTYYDKKQEHKLNFKLMPRQHSSEELLKQELTATVREYSDKTAHKEQLELPISLKNFQLRWQEPGSTAGLSFLAIGFITVAFLWIYGDRELEKRMKVRNDQMLADYPDIINKFTLLVNAGMTIRQAWIRITEDYANKGKNQNFHKQYAYEEMLTTTRELKLGTPESIAYEQFGRRTGLLSYIKFSALISQNLKKGTRGFTELLIQEAAEAFEARKDTARRLGEEAGTKLLVPMMIMLIIVFLIIMIPAFSAFTFS